jgi:NitT/TauT family transport system substrate-binding protein
MTLIKKGLLCSLALLVSPILFPATAPAADKLVAAYAAISPDQLAVLTAAKLKLFEKHDLDVKVIYIGGSTAVTQAMVSGDVEIAHLGGAGILSARAARIDLVYVAAIINVMAGRIIGRPEIKSMADLKGKAIAATRAGSNSDYWARLAISRSGLVPDRDVKLFYTGGLPATYAAMQQGLVAAGTWGFGNPFSNSLMKQGYNQLIDLGRIGAAFPHAGVTMMRSTLQSQRPIVLRYMKAILEGMKVNFTDKPFAKKMIAELTGVKDDDLVEESYTQITRNMNRVPHPTVDGWAELIEFTEKFDPRVKGIKPEEAIDGSIMRELEKSGFIKLIGLK